MAVAGDWKCNFRREEKMEISDIRIRKLDAEGKVRAIASFTIDGVFAVHEIKIIEGERGLFVAMPSKKSADGEYRDIVHPINGETREMIQKQILEAYGNLSE